MDILALTILRAFVEVAGFFLVGQAALHVLAGAGRERNAVYRLFRLLTKPVLAATRAVLPKAVPDRFVAVIAFVTLFLLWVGLAYARAAVCITRGGVC